MTTVKGKHKQPQEREKPPTPRWEVTEDHSTNTHRLGQQLLGTSWKLFWFLMSRSKNYQIYLFKENGPSFCIIQVASYALPYSWQDFSLKKKKNLPNNYYYVFWNIALKASYRGKILDFTFKIFLLGSNKKSSSNMKITLENIIMLRLAQNQSLWVSIFILTTLQVHS